MQYSVVYDHPENCSTDCLVLPIFESKKLNPLLSRVDKQAKGYISKLIASGDIQSTLQATTVLHEVKGIKAKRVLLVGCGAEKSFTITQLLKVLQTSIATLAKMPVKNAVTYLTCCEVEDRDEPWNVMQATMVIEEYLYSFDYYKSQINKDKIKLKGITFAVNDKRKVKDAKQANVHGVGIGVGMNICKDLGNTPANICNPTYLADFATKLGKKYPKLSVANLGDKELKNLKMGALLAVSKGSVEPAKLITMQYRGGKTSMAPIVLIGKGITFDTGGNSLKSPANMIGMKYDMCGAAAVIGTIAAVAELKLPLNVIGVVAAAENMPGGNAIRPDDIITSLSGKTIEVLNTDAEGRLVLCDALTYCERYKPATVIDMATLTGACVVALGRHNSALYSNCDKLALELHNAGQNSLDTCWRMPLSDKYHAQLDSNVADMANIGGPEAGSITAACFLQKFTDKFKQWAHLDIAGTACQFTGKDRHATGRPLPMLVDFLLNRV